MALGTKALPRGRAGIAERLIEHPRGFAVAFVLVFGAIAFLATALMPTDQAIAEPSGGIINIVGEILGINSMVDNALSGLFRGGINACLSLASTIMANSADASMLTKGFGQVWPALGPIVQSLHETIAIPIANIVLAVFLVVGLVKYMQRLGQSDAGADMWTLVMVFVLYALIKSCIDASFPLMVMLFDMCRNAIEATLQMGSNGASVVVTYTAIPESVTGAGWLFLALIVSLIVVIISWVASMVVQLVIMVRMVQIYVYTALAAIPLSTIISDSGRGIATGFMKKYLALLLTGLIIAVLVVMYGVIVTSVGTTADLANGGNADAVQYLWELLGSTVVSCAMIYCMLKCSGWARDIVGC